MMVSAVFAFLWLQDKYFTFPRNMLSIMTDTWLQLTQMLSHCHHAETHTYWAQKKSSYYAGNIGIQWRKDESCRFCIPVVLPKRKENETKQNSPVPLHSCVFRNETATWGWQTYFSIWCSTDTWLLDVAYLWYLNSWSIWASKHQDIMCSSSQHCCELGSVTSEAKVEAELCCWCWVINWAWHNPVPRSDVSDSPALSLLLLPPHLGVATTRNKKYWGNSQIRYLPHTVNIDFFLSVRLSGPAFINKTPFLFLR